MGECQVVQEKKVGTTKIYLIEGRKDYETQQPNGYEVVVVKLGKLPYHFTGGKASPLTKVEAHSYFDFVYDSLI